MEDIFFTVTGCNHYFGTEAFKPRVKVTLYKEPDNKYDKEATPKIISRLVDGDGWDAMGELQID